MAVFEVKPEEVPKVFTELMGGAGATAIFDGILQSIFLANPDYWTGRFPFQTVFTERLPSLDDWIVAAAPGIATLLGALTGNKDLFMTGFGGSLYGGGMLLHHIITRNLPGTIPEILGFLSQVSSSLGQGTSKLAKPKGRYQITR